MSGPPLVKAAMSPSTLVDISFQMRANFLEGSMACCSAPAAVVRSEKQSVRICGGSGLSIKTSCNAHASAAAAVEHHSGGTPKAYPSRSPLLVVTTIPTPVLRKSARFTPRHQPIKIPHSIFQPMVIERRLAEPLKISTLCDGSGRKPENE